jgi:imidazolonepropionase-like amidohydrolase
MPRVIHFALAISVALPKATLAQSVDLTSVPPIAKTVAFVDVTVIPMDRERTLEHQTVIVRDGVITAISAANRASVPADAMRIDGRGKFLLPGLADMHAHAQPGGAAFSDAAGRQMALYLAHGVTTARSLGMAPPMGPAVLDLRRRIAAGELLGPRLFVYSPSLNGNSVPNAAAAAPLVAQYKSDGYDGFKTHGGFSAEVYDSVVAAVKRTGLPLSGHITPGFGLDRAITAGQQVEHLDGFFHAMLPAGYSGPQFTQLVTDPAILQQLDTTKLPAIAQRMAKERIWNGPTLGLFKTIVSDSTADQMLTHAVLKYMPKQTVDQWTNQRRQQMNSFTPTDGRARFVALRDQIVRELYKAGVKLLAGSDSPQWFLAPGDAAIREIEAFVEAGLSPYAALEAATRNPAEYLGVLRERGTVETGKQADLLLLTANPLLQIGGIRKVDGVMIGGRWVDRARIDAMLAAIAAQLAQ